MTKEDDVLALIGCTKCGDGGAIILEAGDKSDWLLWCWLGGPDTCAWGCAVARMPEGSRNTSSESD
jgi:hypothetical protein